MKPHPPHPRLRKTLKWGGLTATVLLAAMWLGSTRASIWWLGPDRAWNIGLEGGLFHMWWQPPQPPNPAAISPGVWTHLGRNDLSWWPVVRLGGRSGNLPANCLQLPLWMALLPAAGCTAWAWRRDRRPLRGHCSCGYDRRGLAPGAVCPECGARGAILTERTPLK